MTPGANADDVLRVMQFAVKMVTDDGDMTTDIVVEGDVEEIERFCKVRKTIHETCGVAAVWE